LHTWADTEFSYSPHLHTWAVDGHQTGQTSVAR
jgi:hypothetical protein